VSAIEPIATPRLDLVPLDPDHAAEMAGVLADPALYTFTGGAPAGPDALRARYEAQVAGSGDPAVSWFNWVLRVRSDGHLAGYVQATVTAAGAGPVAASGSGSGPDPAAAGDVAGDTAELAWVVGTAWQRRGYATEATRALAGWLLSQGTSVLVACIHPDHAASAAVAAAAGLASTGEWRDGEIVWRLSTGADGPA
jgi:RimJ/RimL family protein N-acetyltransferase